MRRADRLFRLLLLLGTQRATTARALAQALEVSLRTIYRDVADLSASGVPIEGEAGVGYRLGRGYRLPALMFEAEELVALAVGVRMVQGWGDAALAKAADSALARIEAVLPTAMHAAGGRHASSVLVPDFHIPPAVVAPLQCLRQAIAAQRKLRIGYQRADAERSGRVVWPLGLVFWGGSWTLGAWCELRGAFRTFRTDRIDPLEVLDEHFVLREGLSFADYVRAASRGDGAGNSTPSPASS